MGNSKLIYTKIRSMIKQDQIKLKYGIISDDLSKKYFPNRNDEFFNDNYFDESELGKAFIVDKNGKFSEYSGLLIFNIIGLYKYEDYKIIKEVKVHPKGKKYIETKNKTYYVVYDPNNIIRLQRELPFLNEKTLYIHLLIAKWSIEPSLNMADRILTEIIKLDVDNKLRKCGNILYRGFNLSPTAIQRLKKGKSVRLRPRVFSSWSESKKQAKRFMKNRLTSVLLKYTPTNEVVININLFEEAIFGTLKFINTYLEEEIILLNSPKMLTIHPHQLVEIIEEVSYQKEELSLETSRNVNLNSQTLLGYIGEL